MNGSKMIESWLTAEQFIQLGIYSASAFYKKAPKNEIAGAFKIGKKWWVDMTDFKNAHKPEK